MLKHILERCQFGDHCDLKRIRFHGGTSNRLGGAILSPRALRDEENDAGLLLDRPIVAGAALLLAADHCPPRRTRNCPERHRGCCALFYSATTGQKLRTTASRQAVVLTLSQPRHARIDRRRAQK